MECEICPRAVRARCGRGLFNGCPYEVDTDDEIDDVFCGPLQERYITSFEELEIFFEGFMEF